MSIKIKKLLSIVGLCILVFANICFLCQPVLNLGKYKTSVNYDFAQSGYPYKSDIAYSFKNGICYQTEKIYYNSGFAVPEYIIEHNQDIYRIVEKFGFVGTEEIKKEDNDKKYERDYAFKVKSVFSIEISTNIMSKKVKLINVSAIIIQIVLGSLIICNSLYIIKLLKNKGEAPK